MVSPSKYQQIFQFLKAFYQLRETTVTDFESSSKYLFKIWLDDIKTIKGSKSMLFEGDAKTHEPLLARIPRPEKPQAPEPPLVPESLQAWFPRDIDNNISTTMLEEIETKEGIVQLDDLSQEDQEGLFQIHKAFSIWKLEHEEYLEEYKMYEHHEQIYTSLFDARNKLESFSERYELLLGIGTFKWRNNHKVYHRPLLVTPLEVEMTESGIIEVRVAVGQSLFELETDFIAGLEELYVPQASESLKPLLSPDEGNLSDKIDTLRNDGLSAFVNKIKNDANYHDTTKPITNTPESPLVHFAPVILLRERSLKSYTAVFEAIISQLQETEEAEGDFHENSLLNLVVYEDGHQRLKQSASTIENVMLPKPSNEEQIQIAQKMQKRPIVVVQGPPGTGKSYTIANIIPFLLSQGKRILVTAQTDQALRALKQHIPESFWDLVIYFLQGSDAQGHDLKKSVQQLQNSVNGFDLVKAKHLLEEQEAKLDALKRNQSVLTNQIKSMLNADQREAQLNDRYTDLPLNSLVDRYRQEAKDHAWMNDEINDVEAYIQSAQLLSQWLNLQRELALKESPPEDLPVVDMSRLISPETFKSFVKNKNEYNKHIQNHPALQQFTRSFADAKALVEQFRNLEQKVNYDQPWLAIIRRDCENGKSSHWAKVSDETRMALASIDPDATQHLARDYEVKVPDNYSYQQLKADAKLLLDYVREGNKLNGILKPLILPKPIKQRRYIFEECQVNGHPCTHKESLQKLYEFAHVQLIFSTLQDIWQLDVAGSNDLFFKLQEYLEAKSLLDTFLAHFPEFKSSEQQVVSTFANAGVRFDSGISSNQLDPILQVLALKDQTQKAHNDVEDMLMYLKSLGEFDCTQQLYDAAKRENWEAYDRYYSNLSAIADYQKLELSSLQLERRLNDYFPGTIAAFNTHKNYSKLSEDQVIDALYWANAGYAIRNEFGTSVNDRLKTFTRLAQDIQEATLIYLKTKAVVAFVDRIDSVDQLNKNLIRWMQAMQQTKGKGKMVFNYKRQAQANLQKISKDIPCWIMPMYRVVNTLKPLPDTFDVVIIDEASQLGPEALFLAYISKKIIVVGDDQQTAPENVGVKIEKVEDLISQHLKGIPDAKFFSTKFSFFDHAYAISGAKDALKEHFRCMPEIIEFSNQLCYRDLGTELIPLKQFGGDRLQPLKTEFVPEGYYEKNVNKPEAEAIVSRIKALLQEGQYEGKTIGIISLQGEAQHILIEKLMLASLDQGDILNRRIVSGRPADFQGDERDIMFLSLVTAIDHSRRALTGEADKRRFNVAMSRAKEQVFLFHSVQLDDLKNTDDLRYQLLNYFKTFRIEPQGEAKLLDVDYNQLPIKPFDSWFEVEVYNEIVKKGYYAVPQYQVGSYKIDLLIQLPNGTRVAVECDGDRYHGIESLEADMKRETLLRRVTKFDFFRVRWSHFKLDPEDALAGLWKMLEKHRIG